MAYKRKYQNEYKKEKESKFPKQVKIKLEIWEKLKAKLEKDNRTFADLVNKAIDTYLNEK